MPPLAHYPNQPAGSNDINYSNGYGSDSSSTYAGATGAEPGSPQDLAARDKYISDLVAAINNAAAHGNDFEREKYKAQYADAEKGRQNALSIARLNSDTSRYGYDQQRQTALDQLKENQRQYDANHDLDLKKYGLQVAEDYTKFASTPDQMWAMNDFKGAMGRVGQGLSVNSVATEAAPHAKTWQDFAALSGYNTGDTGSTTTSTGGGSAGTPSTSSGGSTQYSAQGAGGSDYAGSGDTGGGAATATDPRQTAASAVLKAMPASDGVGHDDQDWAALNAIKSLYFAGKPGTVERLGAARQKTAQAGLARLGYDPNLVSEDYQRAGVGQGSVRAA